QFDIIKKDVSNYASFTPSVEAILNEHFSTSKLELKNNLNRTREALRLSNIDGLIPMDNLSDISSTLLKACKGLTLSSVELNNINRQLSTIDAIYSYKKQATINVSSIWELIDSLNSFKTLANEISKVIKDGAILDNASSKLKDSRKSISNTNQLLDEQVAIFIKDNGSSVVDNIVTKRNDRLCILVKASDKNSFNGFIHGESTSGANTYVEPSNLIPLNNAYQSLNSEEANEIQRLLRELSSKVAKEAYQLQANQDTLVVLDVIFAKAKWGMRHRGIVATLNSQQRLMFKDARHPLISEDKVVANNYEITKPIKALLVSGSNTGGKSVTLKTIGLFTLMSMCAYPVLCSEATLPLYDNIFVNVGDEQSIQASLSTFSAHISNLSNIINNATENSLVLLDEIGSGTDPKEGEAIAIAVLEYLLDKVKATIGLRVTLLPPVLDPLTNSAFIGLV
ncbi:MAG: endonuclease MutS2, partial [Erysipelotrichaceae bacterium]